MRVSVCAHLWRLKHNHNCYITVFCCFFFLTQSHLAWSLALSISRPVSKPQESSCLYHHPPKHWEYKHAALHAGLVARFWRLNLGPNACMASTLPSVPSSEPLVLYFYITHDPKTNLPQHASPQTPSSLRCDTTGTLPLSPRNSSALLCSDGTTSAHVLSLNTRC